MLGEVIEDAQPAPISVEAAFARLWQIRTLKTVIVAFAAIGFGLFTAPVLSNLFMEEEYGTKTFERGLLTTIGGLGLIVVLPIAGRSYDRLYRRDPSRALRLVGVMILPAALLTPVQWFMPNVVLFTILGIPQLLLLTVAFTMVGPVLQSVVPYRLRGMGSALGAIYIFFIGATGGALLSGLLSDEFGPRVAVLAIVIPSTIIGGALIIRSARFIRNDLSLVVAELREEMAEHTRQLEAPAQVPALQVADIDFAYGPVQVLFDVGFEVHHGEVLALLGHQRCGQVDDPARHRRPRHSGARRRAPERPEHHLHHARAAGEARHPHPARRQGRVPGDDRAREPGDGRVRLPRRRRRLPSSTRPRVRPVPCARRSAHAMRRRSSRVDSSRCSRSR